MPPPMTAPITNGSALRVGKSRWKAQVTTPKTRPAPSAFHQSIWKSFTTGDSLTQLAAELKARPRWRYARYFILRLTFVFDECVAHRRARMAHRLFAVRGNHR